jgi:hypothetical protein
MPSTLFSSFDRQAGHFRRYRQPELSSRLKSVGFEVLSIRSMDFLGIVPWWIFQAIGGSVSINPAMTKVYDRFSIRLTHSIEKHVEPLIEKYNRQRPAKLDTAITVQDE